MYAYRLLNNDALYIWLVNKEVIELRRRKMLTCVAYRPGLPTSRVTCNSPHPPRRLYRTSWCCKF